MANIRTHYDNLRVARNAPDSVIKAAYKALCQTYHPDKFQGSNAEAERIMKLINTSYAVLIDPVKRAEHDAWIKEKEAAANPQHEKASFGETGNGTEQEFYKKQETKREYTPPPIEPEPEPPETNPSLYLWRRYFARQIDYIICAFLLSFMLAAWSTTGQSLPSTINSAMNNPNLSSVQQTANWTIVGTFFWVILEPICLSMFGTTLGKALFRLRLVSDNIEPNYWGRSVAVWLLGMGGGIPVISAFFMLNAAAKLKKNGQTEWDKRTGFSVEAESLSILRRASLTVLIVLLIIAYGIIGEIEKHTIPSKQPIQQAQVVQSVPQATLSRKGMFDEFLPKTQVQNVPQDTPQLADDLFDQGRYAEALPLYQGLAEQGNTEAQISLGSMYENGQGVTQDYTQTISWYRKAADQGSSLGQFNLGIMYGTGRGVALNYVQAAYWYRKAADQGIVDAQYNLGWMYSTGRGVAEDYNQAVYWYHKAAKQGYVIAQNNLGAMYHEGIGIPKDETQAVVWYRKAAEQGNIVAQYNLGVMYANGQGVAQD